MFHQNFDFGQNFHFHKIHFNKMICTKTLIVNPWANICLHARTGLTEI